MVERMLDELDETIELMLKELKNINDRGSLTKDDLCCIKEMVEITYKIQIVEAMNDEDGGYSEYYPEDRMTSRMRGRDARTGRYMSRRTSRNYDGHMSGHSLHDRMIAALENTMDQASSDYDREQIKAWIHKIQMDENKQ